MLTKLKQRAIQSQLPGGVFSEGELELGAAAVDKKIIIIIKLMRKSIMTVTC